MVEAGTKTIFAFSTILHRLIKVKFRSHARQIHHNKVT